MEWKAIIRDESSVSDAERFAATLRSDLKNGVLFFKEDKTPLNSPEEILQALLVDKKVFCDHSQEIQVTDTNTEIVIAKFAEICSGKPLYNSQYKIIIRNSAHHLAIGCDIQDGFCKMDFEKFFQYVNWIFSSHEFTLFSDKVVVERSENLGWVFEREYPFPITMDKLSLFVDTYLYRYVMITDGENVVRSMAGNIAKLRALEESEKEIFGKMDFTANLDI